MVPIAIPLTTGAGTISTIVLFAESASLDARLLIAAAICGVSAVNYVTFLYSPAIIRFLGHTGMDIFTKIFGLITLALGIQFIITGLTAAFPVLVR